MEDLFTKQVLNTKSRSKKMIDVGIQMTRCPLLLMGAIDSAQERPMCDQPEHQAGVPSGTAFVTRVTFSRRRMGAG